VKLDWMTLANYAEAPPGGLLYIMGGGWDTINVRAPLEGGPEGAFTFIQGTLVARLLFHNTETDRDHSFALVIADADGRELGKVEGGMRVERNRGLPPSWDQSVNLVLPLTGFPLPGPGEYVIHLLINGQFVGDRPFRVLKLF
jgi:hypothetical protein